MDKNHSIKSTQSTLEQDFTVFQYQGKKEKALARVIASIRETLDLQHIFKTTATEIRQFLKADRVSVFRFSQESEWEGEFICEDLVGEWNSILGKRIQEKCFNLEYAKLYNQRQVHAISDVYQDNISQSYIEILRLFQIRAHVVAPLLQGKQLWGLLCVHQCSKPRNWKVLEIEFISLIVEYLGVALQQAHYLEQVRTQSAQLAQATAREQAAEWQKTIVITIEKIRQSLDLETIFRTTAEEIRELLNADRVAIYRFNPDWSGEIVFESVADGWISLLQEQMERPEFGSRMSECSLKNVYALPIVDTYLHNSRGGRFTRGETYRICNDIYSAGFSECYLQVLESFQARAYVIIAILYKQEIWGLLAVYQNSRPRNWQEDEVYLLNQIGTHLGVALQQAEYLQQMQTQAAALTKAAERQRGLAMTVDKIRQSLDIDTIFKATTQEVRRLLEVERVAIYRFYPDCSGEFVADSIVDGWAPIANPQPVTERLLLQTMQAGKYPRNEIFVPISQGEKLWGLLVAYQNSQPRYWQDEEINLLAQVGIQLGVALQQAESLKQVQEQAEKLAIAKEELTLALQELQQTQTQLIHSEKMAGLGQLVAGVAHEINNPINFIFGNITYVSEYTEDLLKLLSLYQKNYSNPVAEIQEQAAKIDIDYISHDLPKTLTSMKIGADRIRQLVLSLRSFSRLDHSEMKPVDIHEGIDSALLILQHRLNPKPGLFPAIEVVKEYGALPLVECYAAQLNQVFMNILTNAIDALEEMGKWGDGEMGKWRASSNQNFKAKIKNPQIKICTEVIEGHSICVRILDNGCGISEKVRSRIFDPFFTTKEPGKGIGLGLSICYQIVVEKHRGQIKCFSESGEGSEFWIKIPIKCSIS